MEKLFVSIELAIMAKEKEFNEEVFGFYWRDTYDLVYDNAIGYHSGMHLSAPTHQQLIDWFREKHGIYVNADLLPNVTKYKGTFVPLSFIPKKYKNFESYAKDREKYSTVDSYDDYYEALNKALEEAFKLIF